MNPNYNNKNSKEKQTKRNMLYNSKELAQSFFGNLENFRKLDIYRVRI